MLSFNRRFFCFSAVALASGCGFEPVYGPTGSANALRGSVLVDEPSDKNGFDLIASLESKLGAPSNPKYGLSYTIETSVDALAITQAQETTRYNVLGKVTFALRDLNTQEVLTNGTASNFTSFGATSNTVSTRSGLENAYERLMVILSNDITDHLILNAESIIQ